MLRMPHLRTRRLAHFSSRLWLCLFAIAALVCTFYASPGRAADAVNSSVKPQSSKLTIDPKEIQKPWTGDLDGMVQRRVIRVLTVYSKTFYFTDQGVQYGTTYEFAGLFEQDLNKKLATKHIKVKVYLIPVPRDQLLPALIAGKGDIAAANLTVTSEREKLVDFSAPTYTNVSELVLTGPASPKVSSVDDLAGKEIFVRKSSSYYESLVALNQRFAAQQRPAVNIKLAPEELEDEDLAEMLNAGLIPLIVMDKHKAELWKQVFPKLTVHDEIAIRKGGQIAWAIRKGSPKLKTAVDDFVVRHRQGTAAGNMILVRYLKNGKHIKNSASESERKKFLDLVQFFKDYGDKYQVDWLLMAAQGYQESRLDQSVKSRVGAVGVMQIMPNTGKELNVGDISKTQPNIEAGVKYMRVMIDRYYANEPMTNLDKVLFTFASYNAGPARVAKLRKEAAERGLNPNVWFHNVEYVAADRIGAETVTYVSNIYKYYIAYQLIMDARAAKEKAVKDMK
ncbi:extracellular solute-binding protein [Caballeronia calidae]|uniref:Extracellular solute-binding protein n=1 Tax=Caballeronia calidae TaxID=1777139 RepID=A0A158EB85_9BURK|nr:lytic transglycosylase F [Caballeronia calidae]SAL03167.1 extracellular solute-binding protein [Caballeronia calidae]